MRYAIIAAALAVAAPAFGAATPEWQIYQDPAATDSLVQAFVQSEDGTQLILKCDKPGKNKVYAIITTSTDLAPPYNKDLARKISLRFDDRAPKEDRWRYREKTAKAVDAPGERTLSRFLEDLVGANELSVQLFPNDTHSPPVFAEFDVHNAKNAIAKVFDSCKDTAPGG